MPESGYARVKRYRERKRAASDPVIRYCRAVLEWDGRAQTPASGRLALIASDILDAARERQGPLKSVAELMGFGSDRVSLTDSSSVARTGLQRAHAELEADAATDRVPVKEASIRAGLHHAKRLMGMPRATTPGVATYAMWRAMAGFDEHGNETIPDAFRGHSDGQSDRTED